ncbi:MAG: hypothetical protein IPO43_15365 [Rhodoferax sp.]|nr:hypothetical protein [Rhodoferax sp.]
MQFFYAGEKRSPRRHVGRRWAHVLPQDHSLDSEDHLGLDLDRSVASQWHLEGENPATSRLRCPLRLGDVQIKPNFLFHVRLIGGLRRWWRFAPGKGVHSTALVQVVNQPQRHDSLGRRKTRHAQQYFPSTSFGDVKVGPVDTDAVRNIIKNRASPLAIL